jgi:hypothetical protein
MPLPSVCVASRDVVCLLPPTTPPSACISRSDNSIWHSFSRPRSYLDCCRFITAGNRVLSKGNFVWGVMDSVALNAFFSSTLFLRQLSFHSSGGRVQLTATKSVCVSVGMEMFTLCVHTS